MNLLNNGLLHNVVTSEIPKLCRAIPELVSVLASLCVELRALREELENHRNEKTTDERNG